MKAIGLITMLVAILSQVSTAHGAADGPVGVPFLFSEEEQLAQTDFLSAIPHSMALRDIPYFNEALTRLEYMLTRLNTRLNEALTISILRNEIEKAFEPRRMPPKAPPADIDIRGSARYSSETGRVAVGYDINDLRHPKQPMRRTCEAMLQQLKHIAPHDNLGFLWHNTVLGVLLQKDSRTSSPIMETLANSVVHWVRLHAQTRETTKADDAPITYVLQCLRTSALLKQVLKNKKVAVH
jgi:hypothetical protein